MKKLSSENITNFLTVTFQNIEGFMGIMTDVNGIKVARFSTSDPNSLLKFINLLVPSALNNFIESNLKENPKEYDRSIVLYESEETHNTLVLRWV